ncbi:uroporphyrinogen-III synthase [Streptomyces sp. SID11385]|uniref:uroporphyrinogen-III synthase n=1 Tax=Streptomyces sp. SID11385 TaxID=2706031 RepID=UPI0013C88BB6|nr:uroporphyrinogen-III synthase [Streptomyces sp. SID11385]NEA37726.1 uroporphyrinogen-III synthase [Streptomyces sp. SID11385]
MGSSGTERADRQARPLDGFTVAVTADRRAEDLLALLRRRGARVLHGPAMRTVPLEDDAELRTVTEDLIARPPQIAIGTTAVGLRGWFAAAEGWGLGTGLAEALRGARLLARGPKVKGALRAAGLTEEWSPASESMAEVLDHLRTFDLRGARVAVQVHGDPLHEFRTALTGAGADVLAVPVYRWLPPEDPAPLDRLVDAVLAGTVDALPFTSAPAALALLAHAEARGVRDQLLVVLRDSVLVACVGPVTAAPLQALDIPTVTPGRFRLAPLVDLLCHELPARSPQLSVGGHLLALRGDLALVDGEHRPLPPASAALLRRLTDHPGRVVPRTELLRALPGPTGAPHAVDSAISRLRTALGAPGLVQTVVKRGYRLALEP